MSRLFAPTLLLVLTASVAAGPPAPAPGGCGETYTVVRGDTLYSIARRCHSTVVGLAEANRLNDPRRIEVGQRLVMRGPDVPFPMGADKPETLREPDAARAYRFLPGDTIFSLARWARVSVPALLAANPGIDPHRIEIGDAVRLPVAAAAPEPARLRERGTGPGPALDRADRAPLRGIVRRYETLPPPPAAAPPPRRIPIAPPPRAAPEPRRPAPVPPPRAKPDDDDDRRAPEGM